MSSQRITESEQVERTCNPCSHAVYIANNAADPGGCAFNRQNLRWMVMALMSYNKIPGHIIMIGEFYDPGIFTGADYNLGGFSRKLFKQRF